MRQDSPVNLFGLNRAQLESFVGELDGRPYRARQIMKWIYHRDVLDFAEMTDLSRVFVRPSAHGRVWCCLRWYRGSNRETAPSSGWSGSRTAIVWKPC